MTSYDTALFASKATLATLLTADVFKIPPKPACLLMTSEAAMTALTMYLVPSDISAIDRITFHIVALFGGYQLTNIVSKELYNYKFTPLEAGGYLLGCLGMMGILTTTKKMLDALDS